MNNKNKNKDELQVLDVLDSKAETRQQAMINWMDSPLYPKKGGEFKKTDRAYFYQIKSGKKKLGERAARRIERDYNLPEGFFDVVSEQGCIATPKNITLTHINNSMPSKANTSQVQSIELSAKRFSELFPSKNPCDINIATVKNNNMVDPQFIESSLKESDLIFIDRTYKTYSISGVYVIMLNDQPTIKRIQTLSNHDIILSSDNPHIKDEVITQDKIDNIKILGKVVKKMQAQITDVI